jgi:hypothetical protein
MKRVDRENEIFEVLQEFEDEGLEFVVVGGYGVSAYQHRFSVDADIVIRKEDLDRFVEILKDKGFEEEDNRELDVYGGRYVAYVKDKELPVTIDLLVDKLKCRQTDASWSYKHFREHSVEKIIDGSEESVKVRVPEKELLMAVKLHSGWRTDARDIVALADDIDQEQVLKHLDRGDHEKLQEILEKIDERIRSEEFEDSFKGVFSQGELPDEKIGRVTQTIKRYLDRD